MSDQRNEIDTWQQGVFCDEPRYSHIPKSSKDEFIRSEKLRVRPHLKGNAICLCNQPEDAAWIAERLNLAVSLERKLAAVTAERDELKAVAELELQDAEADLAGMKKLWSGYHPMCWEVSQQRVDRIKAALCGEVQP